MKSILQTETARAAIGSVWVIGVSSVAGSLCWLCPTATWNRKPAHEQESHPKMSWKVLELVLCLFLECCCCVGVCLHAGCQKHKSRQLNSEARSFLPGGVQP